ncbi:MAG: glucose-6-phosphate isomerase [Caldilineaceae bacterium]
MKSTPFTFAVNLAENKLDYYDSYTTRRLSDMANYYLDGDAYQRQLAQEDTLLYEVYEIRRPHHAGELPNGMSIVHPGKVGDEYFMTKGHFHAVLETGEVYYCLKGQGLMVMETPEGEWAVEEFRAGHVLYVPPRWAHRSVNTSASEDLVFYFVYPGNAGHDYGTIEKQGFRKLIVERDGKAEIVDNPRWRAE